MHATLDRRFTTPHGEVAWTRIGSGPPLVLMHGTPFSSRVWWEVAAALGERHEVYLWDMPGYGESEKGRGQDVSLAAQQESFTALLRHWGLETPSVAAHDFGGAVALRTALLGGFAFDRLALVDAVAVRPWGGTFFRLVHDSPEVFEALPAHFHEALMRAYVRSAMHRAPREDAIDALVAPWSGTAGQSAFYRQAAQADEAHTAAFEDVLGTLPERASRVGVIWGAEDTWLPLDRGRELAAAVPGAELHVVPGAGHLVQADAPERLTALLGAFLSD